MKKNILLTTLVIFLASMVTTQNSQARSLDASTAGQFEPYVLYSSVTNAHAVGIGDFNDDGLNDAAVTNSAGELKIFLQLENGALASPVTYTAGS